MNKKQHSLWVEAYRCKTLDTYIGSDELKSKISKYIEENDIPHLIFAGTAGLGKTTLAKLIVNSIHCDYIYINASDENGVDVIREKVKDFASSATFQPLKVVILDESDFLTNSSQAALRNLIEEYSLNTRFIFTCNILDNIIEPIQSRCIVYKIFPPSKTEVARHLAHNILEIEGINFELKVLAQYVNEYYPDIRSIIKYLQDGSKSGALIWDQNVRSYKKQLIEALKNPNKTSWNDIRQLLINEQLFDYQTVYRALYDSLDEYSNNNDTDIIMLISEYSYRERLHPDKEINSSDFFIKLLKILNNKNLLN